MKGPLNRRARDAQQETRPTVYPIAKTPSSLPQPICLQSTGLLKCRTLERCAEHVQTRRCGMVKRCNPEYAELRRLFSKAVSQRERLSLALQSWANVRRSHKLQSRLRTATLRS